MRTISTTSTLITLTMKGGLKMGNPKDDDFRIRQMTHRLEALKNGTEIPYVYKTDFEKQSDALFAFFTNRSMRIVFFVIVILVMLFWKYVMIDLDDSKSLLNKTNKLISIYGTSAEPYQLSKQLNDDDLIHIKIYGKTFGEAKTKLQEVIDRQTNQRRIPTIIIWLNVMLIIREIVVANKKNSSE